MTLMSWVVLLIIASVFALAGGGLFIYFAFWYGEGSSFWPGVFIFLFFALILGLIATKFDGPAFTLAFIIASIIIFLILCVVGLILLPNFDNKDVIKAFRPIIIFMVLSGLMILAVNVTNAFAVSR